MPKSLLEIARRKMVPTEHDEQAAVVAWAALQSGKYPELLELFAVPNFAGLYGGRMARLKSGARAKAEGRKPGVEDLVLLVPRAEYHGLLIEVKGEQETMHRVTAGQRWWHERHRARGFRVEVCFGAAAAIQVLTVWCKLKPR